MIESFSLSALLRSLGLSGMISIALAAALAFVVWRADAISSRAEALEADLSAEQTAHEITAASLNEAEGRLSLYIEDGKRREIGRAHV